MITNICSFWNVFRETHFIFSKSIVEVLARTDKREVEVQAGGFDAFTLIVVALRHLVQSNLFVEPGSDGLDTLAILLLLVFLGKDHAL